MRVSFLSTVFLAALFALSCEMIILGPVKISPQSTVHAFPLATVIDSLKCALSRSYGNSRDHFLFGSLGYIIDE